MTRTRPPSGDDGMTLVEVIAAMAVLALASIGILSGVLTASRLSGDGRARVVATGLADSAISAARATPVSELGALGTASWVESVGGRTYTVLRSAGWQPRTGPGSACDSGSGSAFLYKRVSVRVTWPDMGATAPVRSDTLIAPGLGGFNPAAGNLAVKVLGADARANELVTVSVVRAGYPTVQALTDEHGCAFFNGLPAGTGYTVTASKAASVDAVRTASPALAASLTAGTTTALQFDYDRSGTARLSLPSGTFPAPPSLRTSLGHTSLPGKLLVAPAGPWPLVVPGLFPFPAGYRTWVGTCTDADPEARQTNPDGTPGAALWSPAPLAPVVPVVPGETRDAAVPAALVQVTVKRANGTLLAGAQVVATHAADTGCPTGETHVLGTSDANGRVLASLPFGATWTIAADGKPGVAVTLHPAGAYPLSMGVTG